VAIGIGPRRAVRTGSAPAHSRVTRPEAARVWKTLGIGEQIANADGGL
jgi:hypothetical protein